MFHVIPANDMKGRVTIKFSSPSAGFESGTTSTRGQCAIHLVTTLLSSLSENSIAFILFSCSIYLAMLLNPLEDFRRDSGVTVIFFPSQFFPWGKNGPARFFPRGKN